MPAAKEILWNGLPLSLRYLYEDPLTREGGKNWKDEKNNQCQYQNIPDVLKTEFPMLGTSDISTGSGNILELPDTIMVYMLTWPSLSYVDTNGWIDTGHMGNFLGCYPEYPVSIFKKLFEPGHYVIDNTGALHLFSNSGIRLFNS